MGSTAGVAVVAILMGLNLLEVLPFRLPSLDVDVRTLQVPPILQVSAPIHIQSVHPISASNQCTTYNCLLAICATTVLEVVHSSSSALLLQALCGVYCVDRATASF